MTTFQCPDLSEPTLTIKPLFFSFVKIRSACLVDIEYVSAMRNAVNVLSIRNNSNKSRSLADNFTPTLTPTFTPTFSLAACFASEIVINKKGATSLLPLMFVLFVILKA